MAEFAFPTLGRPKRSSSEAGVTAVYRFDSAVPPIRPLRLKIEISTLEHFAVLDDHRHPLAVAKRGGPRRGKGRKK